MTESNVTTVGTLLINDALPEDMRQPTHVITKDKLHKLFMHLAEKHPDKYKDVFQRLSDVGRTAAWTEGVSVSLAALRRSQAKERILAPVRAQLQSIINDDNISNEERRKAVVDTLLQVSKPLQDEVLKESEAEDSPFSMMVKSGARGNKSNIMSLRGADLLATDQNDQLMPVPLLHSYAEGFTPAEYFASSYGQRKGALGVKMATADAGYYSKRIVNAAHRQVVTRDTPPATRLPVGLPVAVDDKDNIGAVLAHDAGDIKAGTVLTDKLLETLKDQGVDDILVHSPMTELTEDGGISQLAAGRRERGKLAQIGDNVGVAAAQAVGEKLSQGMLSSKHSAGVSDRVSKAGMEYLNRLTEAPEYFPEAGPLVEDEGAVEAIRDAPQGGKYVVINRKEYYLHPHLNPTVKVGDHLEQGDQISDGVPHPVDLVRLRGAGEARRVMLKELKEALSNSGVSAHRRNIESVVAGLINWARITDPDGLGEHIYDDIVPLNKIAYLHKPRPTAENLTPERSIGKYLEEPVLHYTPGTKVTKRVSDELKKWKIKDVYAHAEPPAFEPTAVRGILGTYYDPDWKVRLSGFYTSSAFQKSLHRGAESDVESTSYVPAMTDPKVLGRNLPTHGKYGQADCEA